MNRIRVVLPLALVVLGFLAGCSVSPERAGEDQQAQSPRHYDHDYVGLVNRDARRSGVEVIWVNPPRESGSDEDS